MWEHRRMNSVFLMYVNLIHDTVVVWGAVNKRDDR